MSSVFLYVAIVAIWAFVLVPRWLRRHHALPRAQPVGDLEADAPADTYADADDEDVPDYDDYRTDEAPPDLSAPMPDRVPTTASFVPRSRMLQARRRLLTMLVLLTAAAGACTAARLTPWWTCVPPAGVLGGYFLLLRTAARADVDHARRTVAAGQAQAARVRAAARAQALADAATPGAQIIDISSRVGDQLYDQYADATVRAVGD